MLLAMRFLVSLVSCLCGLVSIQGKTPAFPIIDTHVHQAKLGKFNYTFPATFPSLNKSWCMLSHEHTFSLFPVVGTWRSLQVQRQAAAFRAW